jgi:hypothetical protein
VPRPQLRRVAIEDNAEAYASPGPDLPGVCAEDEDSQRERELEAEDAREWEVQSAEPADDDGYASQTPAEIYGFEPDFG